MAIGGSGAPLIGTSAATRGAWYRPQLRTNACEAEVMQEPSYPFVPKSNAYLRPGQFWSIPLVTGKYTCGRVLEIDRTKTGGGRVSFWAGLMDWVGEQAPAEGDLAGVRQLVHHGQAHILAITSTGGSILGLRPLEDDGVELPLEVDTRYKGASLYKGFRRLRDATDTERQELPIRGALGYSVLAYVAEDRWGDVEKWRRRQREANPEYRS